MTDSPSETTSPPADAASSADDTAELAAAVAAAVGGTVAQAEFGTAKVAVERGNWSAAITAARDEAGLDFFNWLSAIDWTKETTLGEGVAEPDAVEERFEVLCMLSTLTDSRKVIFSVDLAKDDASLPSLTPLFGGAEWHERETAEMFGIDFAGHPNPVKLYLPSEFEGHPLLKSFPLLSREVKPWPGKVDVEDMPSTENPEAPPAEAAAENDDGASE
ncbi:MAG: NADH-quinone oxidoreductase subunit C [Acidimicrobiia bacterium]